MALLFGFGGFAVPLGVVNHVGLPASLDWPAFYICLVGAAIGLVLIGHAFVGEKGWRVRSPVHRVQPTVTIATDAATDHMEKVDHLVGHRTDSDPHSADSVAVDLQETVVRRFGEFPLREAERQVLVYILRQAIDNIDDLPFTGQYAIDIQDVSSPLRGVGNEVQIWQIPLEWPKGINDGVIKSDATLVTLYSLHTRLMDVRHEVYRKYHRAVNPDTGAPMPPGRTQPLPGGTAAG